MSQPYFDLARAAFGRRICGQIGHSLTPADWHDSSSNGANRGTGRNVKPPATINLLAWVDRRYESLDHRRNDVTIGPLNVSGRYLWQAGNLPHGAMASCYVGR